MIKFFRHIRRSLLNDNKMGKYFKYAFGEIVLVVIGILIALQINNWNENLIKENELLKVHERLILDIDNDIVDLVRVRNFWNDKQPIFNKVVNDSISRDLLDKGLSRLITSPTKINLNVAGVNQLKRLNVRDELSLGIIQSYDNMKSYLEPIEKRISDDINDLILIFRDNYSWYGEWLSKTINKDNSSKALQDYFVNSIEYRNRVIHLNAIVFKSFLFYLDLFIDNLETTRTDLIKRTNTNYKISNKKELEKYAGEYQISESSENQGSFRKDDTLIVTAHEGFIRYMPQNNKGNFVDYYLQQNGRFFADMDFGKSEIEFENDNKTNVISMVEKSTTPKLSSTVKASKIK